MRTQRSLTLSPRAGIHFRATPRRALRARGATAGPRQRGFVRGRGSRRSIAFPGERSGPAPRVQEQQSPAGAGVVIGSPGRARRGVGRRALARLRPWHGEGGSSGTHTPLSACPELPFPAGTKLSPPHPFPGKPLPLEHSSSLTAQRSPCSGRLLPCDARQPGLLSR